MAGGMFSCWPDSAHKNQKKRLIPNLINLLVFTSYILHVCACSSPFPAHPRKHTGSKSTAALEQKLQNLVINFPKVSFFFDKPEKGLHPSNILFFIFFFFLHFSFLFCQ